MDNNGTHDNGLVKIDDLMTEFVAAGLFLPVVLAFQNTVPYFFSVASQQDLVKQQFTLCLCAAKFLLFICASMLGVLLLGYSFHDRTQRNEVALAKPLAFAAAFVLFSTIMGAGDYSPPTALAKLQLQIGFSGTILFSFWPGLSAISSRRLWERWPEEYTPLLSTTLICISAVLCEVCDVYWLQ